MAKGTLGVRAEQDTLDRLDVLADALSTRAAGTEITRSDAARVALARGLDELEREFAIAKKGPKPARKPAKK